MCDIRVAINRNTLLLIWIAVNVVLLCFAICKLLIFCKRYINVHRKNLTENIGFQNIGVDCCDYTLNASEDRFGKIRISYLYFTLLLYDPKNTFLRTALSLTIQHEIGHQKHRRYKTNGISNIAANWIDEVFADTYAIKETNISVNLFESCCIAKAYINALPAHKRKHVRFPSQPIEIDDEATKQKYTKCDNTHPSWQNRVHYIKKYSSFSPQLICEIIMDAYTFSHKTIDISTALAYSKDIYVFYKKSFS